MSGPRPLVVGTRTAVPSAWRIGLEEIFQPLLALYSLFNEFHLLAHPSPLWAVNSLTPEFSPRTFLPFGSISVSSWTTGRGLSVAF